MATAAEPLPSLYRLRHDLVDAFDDLIAQIDELLALYETHPQPMWSLNGEASLEWLRRTLFDLWYEDGQPGNYSRAHIGLVGANPEQLAQVAQVNLAKQRFAHAVQALRDISENALTLGREDLNRRSIDKRKVLGYSALARLHLKQTYRRLPTPDERLLKVHFSWYSSGRSIRRVTVREAEQMLAAFHNQEAAHIKIQYQKLASIPDKEPLAAVRPQAPIMRINMFFETPNVDLKTRKGMSVSMPLFVPLREGEPLPDFNVPDSHPPLERTRPVRVDTKIEEDPFLPSLHIHRYKT